MLKNIKNPFTAHPNSVNETYLVHFKFAIRIGVRMILAGFACSIHSVFPFLFKTTASRTVKEINELMIMRVSKRANAFDIDQFNSYLKNIQNDKQHKKSSEHI